MSALPTPERLRQTWRFAGYGALAKSQPLIPAGDRLLGVSKSTLFAVDIFRGEEPEPDAQVDTQGFPYDFKYDSNDPFVTVAGGVAYFMDGEYLIALRVSDGLPLQKRNKKGVWEAWESPVLPNVTGLIAAEGKVVAVHLGESGSTAVSAFVAVNGEPAFGPIDISELSPGRIGYGDGAVFFIIEGRMYAVNVDFGDKRYERTGGGVTNEALHASVAPCVARDVVVAAGDKLHFFDVKTGAEIFEPIGPVSKDSVWSTPILANKGSLFIASNSDEVVAVRAADGKIEWRTRLANPGEPTLLRGQVLVLSDDGKMLNSLSLKDGTVERRMELPEAAGSHAPVVTNDTVFIPDARGSIEARPFAKQHAAYFDGRSSRIDILAEGEQFDFGTEDFSIEAWIRSSEGGEIVSSYPTLANTKSHGFRLNLGPNGELRVAIIDPETKSVQAGRTRETNANDGEWHHVALIRRESTLLALLDGKSHDVFFRDDSQAGLSVGGRSALTIGAYIPGKGRLAENHFQGLIRELRIWDRALDVATVQNNRHVQLSGTEPRLKGLWSLSEVQQNGATVAPENKVARANTRATFVTPASSPTDLSLDRSGYPYLLHEVETHWPYAGTWAARGELPVSTRPAIADNAIAFASNNALYGVRRADGRRLWQSDLARGSSTPVADGARFLVLDGEEGIIAVNAMTGETARVDEFAGLVDGRSSILAAPVISTTHIVAGGPSGRVKILDRQSNPVIVRDVTVPAPVRELALHASHAFAMCGPDNALQIAVLELATGNKTLQPVGSVVFTTEREWLFYVRHNAIVRAAAATPGTVQVQAPMSENVTGMAARADRDLLVVTTDNGSVHGYRVADLSRRWTARLDGSVHAPVIDAAGRIYCSTAAGAMAVLDPATGARIGLYRARQAITTPPVMAAATVYYGCADANDANAYRDGAMHSVVFGETMVLRLGLDERGAPSRAQPYALVDIPKVDVNKHTLHLMDPTRSCVEAWINMPASRANSARRPGGGVIGICPTEKDGFDVNVAIDEDGTLHYSARSLQNKVWTTLRAQADTNLNDGQWHHLALSRDGADHVTIYIDAQPVPNVIITRSEEAAPRTVTGIKAYLGAMAGADLEAVRPFCGMIAEVRVWDTYMEPAEIAARMHVKLRGTEPDLLAYWNFDLQSVEDASAEHHHGKLVGVDADPVWWLTDLAFEKPSYPYVTTSGKMIPQGAGQPPMYQVAFTVHRADGTGIAGHPLDMWYVRQGDADPVATLFDGIAIDGVIAAAQPEPGAPSPDGKQRVYSVTTESDGTAIVRITPLDTGHAPAIDLRAGFMPRNERFHINVLLDQQVLVTPIPPLLVAQSKLIQDYAYSSGGVINEDRDRSTWRTVIRAENPDGSPRVGEPVSLWATEQLNVEVAGRKYAINTENSAELVTDPQGEVVIVFDANALNAAGLMARAAFMHRNDRITIAPDQDLHRKLSNAQGADFTAKKTTRWKPGMDDGDGEALLSKDYEPHAGKIADAVVTVMSAAKPADADPAPVPRGGVMLKSKRLLLKNDALALAAPMRQPPRETGSDRVVTLRTRSHTPRSVPLNPNAMRNALGQNTGFVFESVTDARGKQGVRFEILETPEQAELERGTPTPKPMVLRGFFDDLWDVVVDTATDIYEGVEKVVVTVVDAVVEAAEAVARTVEIAIHKVIDGIKEIVHVVVDSIVEAVNAVAGFFEQIGVAIMKAIEFLRALFNWKAILATKNIIHELFIISIDGAKKSMSPARIESALSPLIDAASMKPASGERSIAATTAAAGEANSPATEEARSVQGQMVMQKSRENNMTTTRKDEGPKSPAVEDPFVDIVRQIPLIMGGVADLSPSDLIDKLLGVVKDGVAASVRLFIKELTAISAAAIQIIDWAMQILRTEINIPFLSDLYEWITGSKLTMLDLICLALAVPVHIAHIAVTTMMGETRTFADDNQGLVARVKAQERAVRAPQRKLELAPYVLGEAPQPPARVPRLERMDTSMETLIIVLRAINIAAGLASDSMFAKTVSSGGIGAASQGEARVRAIAKVIKGASGIFAGYYTTFYSNLAFEKRLKSGVTDETWDSIKPMAWVNPTVFAVMVAGDCITLGGGIKQAFMPPKPRELDGMGPIEGDWIDQKEYTVARFAVLGCIAAITARTYFMIDTAKKLRNKDADEKLIMQVYLFGARDIAAVLARLPWFMFTQSGANWMREKFKGGAPTIYGGVTVARAVLMGISLGTHVVAVYHYGQNGVDPS